MGTASTMACLVETLGLALPMSATAPATHADRRRIAEASGRRAAEMAVSGAPLPSDLITEASMRNAMIVLQAIGGSTNGLIHLIAIAMLPPACAQSIKPSVATMQGPTTCQRRSRVLSEWRPTRIIAISAKV